MKLRYIIWFIGLWSLGIVLSQIAWGKSIDITDAEVWSDEPAPVNVIVDDPSGIAGAAFTIQYDASNLDLISVDITDAFFDLLVVNPDAQEGTAVAAGRATPQAGTGPQAMFSLKFALKPGADPREYPIKIVPTTIVDPANGWPEGGPPADPLVGAVMDNVPLDEAFPTLLRADELENLGEGLVKFNAAPPEGQYTFTVEIEPGIPQWEDVIVVPDGHRAKIVDMFYVFAQTIKPMDYGAVMLRWKGETDWFTTQWFVNRYGESNKPMNLYVASGKTLQAKVYKASRYNNYPSRLSFTVEWEKAE